jgi:hypothetical protein
VADSRPLKDDRPQWDESTVIAMGRRTAAAGTSSVKVLLSEDFAGSTGRRLGRAGQPVFQR